MRTVFAISSAITLFTASVFASKNADFNPVNFVDGVAAAPASLTNEFVTFRWKGEESVAMETFNLNVENTARIQVTDFKNRGDMFEVFDNGQSLGMTTKVDTLKDEEVFAATPEEALNDDRFSKGIFDLATGEHKITIKAMGPYEAGTAAIRVLDQANVAFHKKGSHHDDDDDDNDDDNGHKDDDDEDDNDDKKHGHGHKGGDHDDDDEEGKGDWHKDSHHDDDEGGKGDWHKGGDHDDEEGGKGDWHKGGDHDDEEGGKGDWHKGGDHDDEEGGKGDWHKGGDHDDEEGGKGDWHKGSDKWSHKRPTDEEYDLSHTITLTKTKWVVQKPTHVGTIGIVPL